MPETPHLPPPPAPEHDPRFHEIVRRFIALGDTPERAAYLARLALPHLPPPVAPTPPSAQR